MQSDCFGEHLMGCEPNWYQGFPSPYYTDSHKDFRKKCREFVETEMKPHVEDWIKSPEGYPASLHAKAYQAGVQGIVFPKEFGGSREDHDYFHELILWDELARCTGGVLAQLSINSMGMPPVSAHGSEELKARVIPPVVKGEKTIALMISEPYAGSDVAGVKTTAERQGDHFVVNGQKKWITGGHRADFFTCAVRTGDPGFGGISLLLIPSSSPGITIRKMETQFDNTNGTAFVTLEDVRVPEENLIGDEGMGFMYLMYNFNHERFVIAVGACRAARNCYEESIKYALKRRTFGKQLIEHQAIRMKLAEMLRQIEAVHDSCERVAYALSQGVPDLALGATCALLKVNSSRCFEFCAREASQIFGGSSIVREGQGKLVERLYRDVRQAAIPGGSEEILLDFTIRQAVAKDLKKHKAAKI
mmetsp:Transcript_7448/g.18463  ORF Transcript_7448/g.18463 Transcript_7448/m.18463 type:complete len:418 (+) Transcript_7448:23-1276(+)